MFWYNQEIERLEKKELVNSGRKRAVFYGSSSFTRWTTMETEFNKFQAINLGFGGSTLAACTWYFERVVPRQLPDVLYIYAGDNDIGDGRTPEEVIIFYKQITAVANELLGNIPICYVSIKLSPARKHLFGSIEYANACIKEIVRKNGENLSFLNIYPKMMDQNGKIISKYFDKDGLHLSAEGYMLWKDEFNAHYESILGQIDRP